ncbi:MAG: CRTAC1 family protein [Gemmatimonadales bacterium]
MHPRSSRRSPREASRNRSGAAIVAAAAALAAAACRPAPPPAWHQEAGYRWQELRGAGGRNGFTRVDPARSGIGFRNDVPDSTLLANRILAEGAGVALGDVDGDGLADVFLARTAGPSRLYRNLGGWRFEDITDRAGIATADRHATGAALADLDGDGDLDLLLLATDGPNAVFLNDGAARFTERRDLGLDPAGRGGTTLALADVDGDGDLDVYVANYKRYNPSDRIAPGEQARIVREVAPGRFEVAPEHRADFRLVTPPGRGGQTFLTMRGEPDQLYLNEDGRLREVPFAAGRFRDASGTPLAEAAESFAVTARFTDLDGDGAPDLYVANDFEDPDRLWFNDGTGTFHAAPWTAQRQTSNSGMGIDVGDVDGDGRPDLFELDMLANDRARRFTQVPATTPQPKRAGDLETQFQDQRNTLFLNRGDRTFAEIGAFAGVTASGWSWATLFLDVDLDGREDLLIANGHRWDVMDGDVEALLARRAAVGAPATSWRSTRPALANVASEPGRCHLRGREPGLAVRRGARHLPRHGKRGSRRRRRYRPGHQPPEAGPGTPERCPAPRIAVRLVGDAPNTRAVGARITVRGGAAVESQEIAAGRYLSHSDYLASFATGPADSVTIEVVWRDGRRASCGRRVPTVSTRSAQAPRPPARDARGQAAALRGRHRALGGHTHVEAPFDDWSRQFLLPEALSQLGPGISWFDLDRDGDGDLLVGTGRGGRLGVFRNERGTWCRAAHRQRRTDGPHHGPRLCRAGGALAPRGRCRLGSRHAGRRGLRAGGRGRPGAAPGAGGHRLRRRPPGGASTGPLALGDYDGDGDLDLFVGGRAVPEGYPAPASSALYRNDGGRFVPDPAAEAILRDVGLVSAALFTDLDGDGDPDLVLARDWGTILWLVNDGGRFQ